VGARSWLAPCDLHPRCSPQYWPPAAGSDVLRAFALETQEDAPAFPLLSGIFSLLYLTAVLFPTVILDVLETESLELGVVEYVVLFAAYMGLAFITTFFNVCVVYTSKVRFEGGDATFMESIRFAGSRLHRIVAWSVVAATVGVLLRAINNAAARAGPGGQAIVRIFVGLLGAAWTVLTLFVVPVMVYEDLGPLDAIKRSTQVLRATWGESLARHHGLGFMQTLFLLPCIFVAAPLATGAAQLGTGALIAAAALALVYGLGVILVFAAANGVFNTALYAYATHAKTPDGFDDTTLQAAFRSKA
jgi:hypothetical protein